MKRLYPYVMALSLIACSRQDVDPDTLTEIDFHIVGGIEGGSYQINLTPTTQRYKRGAGLNPKQCVEPLTTAEWNNIRQAFNRPDFDKLPRKAENYCCDHYTYRLTVKGGKAIEVREWDTFMRVAEDSLLKRIRRQMGALEARCR